MGKIFTALSRLPRRFSLLAAMVVAAVIVPATLLAWGPDRPTFTEQNPAPYVTFNSITNNSFYGDERNFTTIKDAANTADGGWTDTVTAQPGKEYLVRMYVHNNAADNLHLTATNVRATAAISAATGKKVAITGYVNADNANPGQIHDDVNLTSDKNFNLAYVPGSAKFHNNVGDFALPDTITGSNGAKLGYSAMDGNIPGCYKYSGWVYFKVKPQFAANPNFTTSKYVSKHDANKWVKDYQAQPGETVDYLINYKNTGDIKQDNVTLKDTLPAGVSYVDGTTILHNSTTPNGTKSSDNITKVGINIGTYTPGANAWVTFSAKVAGNDNLAKCGPNTLKNVVRTTASGAYKEDSADVNVPKVCKPNECKPGIPMGDARCTDTPPCVPSKDNSCGEVPPTELPHTGASDDILAIVGAGSLIASIGYFIASRRNLIS